LCGGKVSKGKGKNRPGTRRNPLMPRGQCHKPIAQTLKKRDLGEEERRGVK